MSYDLFFCRRQSQPLSLKHVIKYFRKKRYFKVPLFAKKIFQIQYNNKDTGVYFCFDYVHRNDRETDENIIPSDWHDTGFCFTLNYLRPTFFAYEAMPIVEEFANEFQLFIADAQDERSHGPIVPNLCHSNELIESWKRSNVTAVKAHQKLHGDINYMPEEQSRLWWQYSREKSRLQKQLGCTIFVPSIFIFKKQKEPGLLTAISWTEGISQVFPESDYIIIIRNQKHHCIYFFFYPR